MGLIIEGSAIIIEDNVVAACLLFDWVSKLAFSPADCAFELSAVIGENFFIALDYSFAIGVADRAADDKSSFIRTH